MRSGSQEFLYLLLVLAVSSTLNSGCGQFLNNLRRGWDDPQQSDDNSDTAEAVPDRTEGGNWRERGYLSGKQSRAPSSDSTGNQEDTDTPNSSFRDSGVISSASVPNYVPQNKRQYKNGSRATRDDFIDESQEEGSLWASSGQTNYYFTKNKIRAPGDLITLVIDNDLYRDIGVEIKRTLSYREKEKEIGIIQDQFHSKFFADLQATRGLEKKDAILMSSSSAGRSPAGESNSNGSNPEVEPSSSPSPAPSSTETESNAQNGASPAMTPEELQRLEKMVPRATLSDVDIYPSIEVKAGDTMMGEIVERFPNGNYKIRTLKRVPYKKGPPRLVSVVGIVKGADINEDTDTINASKLYEYRVEVSH